MNAERLHVIVKALKQEMDSKNLVGLLQNLVNGLSALGQQNNASTQQNLASYRSAIFDALRDSPVDKFSPTWKQIVKEIGGGDLFGEELKRTIERAIETNQMTPAVAAGELEPIRARMEQFHSALTQASSAFSTLKIGDERLSPGECEIGMLIPRSAVGNRLVDLSDDLKELSGLLNVFSEVATGAPDDLKIRTISSSAFLVYVVAGSAFAACVSKGIAGVIGLYKQLLEIRKLQGEIRLQGVPEESTKGIEEYANQHMDLGIRKLSVEIVDEFYAGQDDGRKNELKTAVRFSLNNIANRIDNGYNIEVRCQPLPAPKNPDDNKQQRAEIATVQAASASMQFLNLTGKPILRLAENAETERGGKASVKLRGPRKRPGKTPQQGEDHKS